jgi:Leucine-rich repeat (LRR) protein
MWPYAICFSPLSHPIPFHAYAASLALFDTGISGNIPDLSALQKLEVFKVENCKLVGDGYTSLYSVPSLKVMGIAGNEFITGSLTGIEQLVNLEELYISATKLDGSLPEEMGQLTKLKYIESSETMFTGTIPTSFGNFVNLEKLDFSLNQLSGRLPEEFGQLTKLENIALYGNGEMNSPWVLIYSFLKNAN